MQGQEGNEGRQGNHYEKRQASNPGRMPDLWHEDVQNRQELGLLRHSLTELGRAGYSRYRDVQPFFILRITLNKLMFSPFPHFVTATWRTIQQIEFGDNIQQNWMFALFYSVIA